MVSTIWVLNGNETVPRLRLGTAIPGLQDEVWGWRGQRGDQEVSPNSLANSQMWEPGLGEVGQPILGGSWPVGTWAWTLGSWVRGKNKARLVPSPLLSPAEMGFSGA